MKVLISYNEIVHAPKWAARNPNQIKEEAVNSDKSNPLSCHPSEAAQAAKGAPEARVKHPNSRNLHKIQITSINMACQKKRKRKIDSNNKILLIMRECHWRSLNFHEGNWTSCHCRLIETRIFSICKSWILKLTRCKWTYLRIHLTTGRIRSWIRREAILQFSSF